MGAYVLSLGTSITEVRITKMHLFFPRALQVRGLFSYKIYLWSPSSCRLRHSGEAKAPKWGLAGSRVAGLAGELGCRLPNFQANGMAKWVWVGQILGTRATPSDASHRDAVLKLI